MGGGGGGGVERGDRGSGCGAGERREGEGGNCSSQVGCTLLILILEIFHGLCTRYPRSCVDRKARETFLAQDLRFTQNVRVQKRKWHYST